MSAVALKPEPWVELSPTPWWCDGNGVVMDAEGSAVCVLDDPFEDLGEQAIRNGVVILAAPAMLEALKALQAVRPFNWSDDEDPEHVAAWAAADAAVLLAEPAGEAVFQVRSADPQIRGLSGEIILDEFAFAEPSAAPRPRQARRPRAPDNSRLVGWMILGAIIVLTVVIPVAAVAFKRWFAGGIGITG